VFDIVVKRFTFAISSPNKFLVVFSFSLFLVFVSCANLSWPSRQFLSARKYTVSYRIVPSVLKSQKCNNSMQVVVCV